MSGIVGEQSIPLTKGQWRATVMSTLLLTWTTCWSNSRAELPVMLMYVMIKISMFFMKTYTQPFLCWRHRWALCCSPAIGVSWLLLQGFGHHSCNQYTKYWPVPDVPHAWCWIISNCSHTRHSRSNPVAVMKEVLWDIYMALGKMHYRL